MEFGIIQICFPGAGGITKARSVNVWRRIKRWTRVHLAVQVVTDIHRAVQSSRIDLVYRCSIITCDLESENKEQDPDLRSANQLIVIRSVPAIGYMQMQIPSSHDHLFFRITSKMQAPDLSREQRII